MQLKIDGVKEVIRDIEKKSEQVQRNVQFTLEARSQAIRTKAMMNTPIDTARLRSSIQVSRPTQFTREVYTGVRYAPYVEFGTGAYAADYLSDKSQELRTYAMTFYKNGKGRMPAHPFMLPAFESEKPKLMRELKKAVRK